MASRPRNVLPRGGALPYDQWERRHQVILAFVWISLAGLTLYGLVIQRTPTVHGIIDLLPMAVLGALAAVPRLSVTLRSLCSALALLFGAALLVHFSGGLIDMHFAFFVAVVVLTLYETWLVFGLAVAFVLVHHGLLGTLHPELVFERPEQFEQPWLWAGIHALFVAAAGIAAVVAWRLNEDVRTRMRETQEQLARAATTDSLTGLANRRQLMADLEQTLHGDERPDTAALALLDLNGFKLYNDTFGHLAGDALLARLGGRLRANLAGEAKVYRLGGDEFCALTSTSDLHPDELARRAAAALYEDGEGFSISAASGAISLPREAASPEAALRLADHRMYVGKATGRASAGQQSRNVLLRALAERHPGLAGHVDGVAALAERVADRLGVDGGELDQLHHAAALHDVGKVAVPATILNKPGPLDAGEWDFMRRHTIVGERIVSGAPALTQAAALVRSSHERWDGGGYPDGLAGDTIPLGSRIIAVCDAYEAMTATDRPYRRPRSHDDAIAELERCAGTQFDPAVVRVLVAVLTEAPDRSLAAA